MTRTRGITSQVRAFVLGMVVLVVVAGVVGSLGVAVATRAVDRVSEDLVPAARANQQLLADVNAAESGLRGWLVTGDRALLAPYEEARDSVARQRLRLRQYAEAHPAARPTVRRQDRAVERWFAEYAEPRLDRPAGPERVSHQALVAGARLLDAVRATNRDVQRRLDGDLDDARIGSYRLLPWVVVVLLLVAALGAAAALVARRVTARMTDPLVDLQETVDRLAAGDTAARATPSGPPELQRVGEAINNFADRNARVLDLEREAIERLQGLDRAKSDFVSNVSHELRTPLTSIAGYVELFEDGFISEISPQQRGMLVVVNRNVHRLQALIEDLLTLSKVEAQTFRTSFDVLDLNHLVADVAHDLERLAADRGITVAEVHPREAMVLRGDASQLSRALLNLVSNAVKFSRDGGEVLVRTRALGDEEVQVEVVDHGIGIPAQDLGSLASRFFRASNAVDAEIPGTGLGLKIVQTIVGNHGGRLELESVEGQGTTARVVLPLGLRTGEEIRSAVG